MMIARWHVDARFGHKREVIDSLQKWMREIGAQLGWTDRARILTGSVGALEATVVTEIEIGGLGELHEAWEKLSNMEAHRRWAKELEPNVVSGSTRWTIYRVVD